MSPREPSRPRERSARRRPPARGGSRDGARCGCRSPRTRRRAGWCRTRTGCRLVQRQWELREQRQIVVEACASCAHPPIRSRSWPRVPSAPACSPGRVRSGGCRGSSAREPPRRTRTFRCCVARRQRRASRGGRARSSDRSRGASAAPDRTRPGLQPVRLGPGPRSTRGSEDGRSSRHALNDDLSLFAQLH